MTWRVPSASPVKQPQGGHGAGASLDTADGVELLGALACPRGRWEDGVRLLAAAAAVRHRLGYGGRRPVSVCDAAMTARAAAEEAVAAAWPPSNRRARR